MPVFCRFLLVLFGSVPVKTMIWFFFHDDYFGQNHFSETSATMQPRNMVQTESNKKLLLMETLPAKIEVLLGFRIYFFRPFFPIFASEIIITELQLALFLCLVTQLT